MMIIVALTKPVGHPDLPQSLINIANKIPAFQGPVDVCPTTDWWQESAATIRYLPPEA